MKPFSYVSPTNEKEAIAALSAELKIRDRMRTQSRHNMSRASADNHNAQIESLSAPTGFGPPNLSDCAFATDRVD